MFDGEFSELFENTKKLSERFGKVEDVKERYGEEEYDSEEGLSKREIQRLVSVATQIAANWAKDGGEKTIPGDNVRDAITSALEELEYVFEGPPEVEDMIIDKLRKKGIEVQESKEDEN